MKDVIDKLNEALLPQNEQCDGAVCMGCWKDAVRSAIKILEKKQDAYGTGNTDFRRYEKYVGQYVKRFYAPFNEASIWKIGSYREVTYFEDGKPTEPRAEFHYWKGQEEFWADVEDSVIITNEQDISDDERVANVKHPRYIGWNPFDKTIV